MLGAETELLGVRFALLTRRVAVFATPAAVTALILFSVAYALVIAEDRTGLRKSIPVMLAAGTMWMLVALDHTPGEEIAEWVKEATHDFGELFLFLLSAIAYVTAIGNRNVFRKLAALLLSAGLGLRGLFWATGAVAFVLSPIADNLTTALLMGAVVTAVARDNARFVATASANVVVAANAGGAFSPFGDLTTLMVWQAGHVSMLAFLALVVPALISWLLPAAVMHFTIPPGAARVESEPVELAPDWWVVVVLFALTVVTAVTFFGFFGLPPFLGMTTGLGYYMAYCWFDCRRRGEPDLGQRAFGDISAVHWDTLLFFFGVIMCVGALAAFGYLEWVSALLFEELGPTTANIGIGLISAVLDNVPVMFAVLEMDPAMEPSQWLLVTLTAGIGGSVLSIGSAAGVALMGSSHGAYTFTSHLRWTPVIMLGYSAGVLVHLWVNSGT